MPNSYFQFKQFIIHQDRSAMKVTTDACLFGAWVANDLKRMNVEDSTLLDIGTGTGLLALMVMQKNPTLTIDAIELDSDAAAQARNNIALSPWKESIKVAESDARTFHADDSSHDFIVSNPPFYENELKSADERKNLAHHGGLSFSELLLVIRKNLKPAGIFYLLLPYKRNREILKAMVANQLSIAETVFVRQSPRHDYFRVMLKGSVGGSEKEMQINEISIRDESNQYTPAFVDLLSDYYLRL